MVPAIRPTGASDNAHWCQRLRPTGASDNFADWCTANKAHWTPRRAYSISPVIDLNLGLARRACDYANLPRSYFRVHCPRPLEPLQLRAGCAGLQITCASCPALRFVPGASIRSRRTRTATSRPTRPTCPGSAPARTVAGVSVVPRRYAATALSAKSSPDVRAASHQAHRSELRCRARRRIEGHLERRTGPPSSGSGSRSSSADIEIRSAPALPRSIPSPASTVRAHSRLDCCPGCRCACSPRPDPSPRRRATAAEAAVDAQRDLVPQVVPGLSNDSSTSCAP